MNVYKFGGASVKNALAVKNIAKVIQITECKNAVVVISAMGKTTNAMELIVKNYFENKSELQSAILEVINFHHEIIQELFGNDKHPVFNKIKILFEEIKGFLAWNKSPKYSFVYDQIVGYGELISTTIISEYLNEININNNWVDVRDFIKTDNNNRDAKVNWPLTQEQISTNINTNTITITQGFIASDENNFTTTLGREGSDYTAAIFAYCLNASSTTIWKDVPGVLNADPRYFKETELLTKISYREAIELAFYGASVIHPKTLQPLQRKEIPLYVKSFINPTDEGTLVTKGNGITPTIPCFIVKKDQVLLKLSSLDFSFIVEDSISAIFKLFHDYKMKVDLIQNSAISFSVCLDNKFNKLPELLKTLKSKFKVTHYEGVSLFTIRHFNDKAITTLQEGKEVLLEQRTQETVQLVVK